MALATSFSYNAGVYQALIYQPCSCPEVLTIADEVGLFAAFVAAHSRFSLGKSHVGIWYEHYDKFIKADKEYRRQNFHCLALYISLLVARHTNVIF